MKHLFGPINRNGRGPFRVHASLLFEPRDLWVGVYWDTYWETGRKKLTVYLTVVPMLPIRITATVGHSPSRALLGLFQKED